ncbi:protein adenylyltransferase Fic [Enterococcus casseliflavus]|uniref:protein adenylyltransferase Fic n=1 Tax=Enterococcus casseliflavus TaxID=37734 RepID=UPI0035E252D8
MILDNNLGLTNQAALDRAEEKLSKQKAKKLYDSGKINEIEVGTFKGLAEIHEFLFSEIYDFAGNIRTVNIAKGNFQFAPVMYLEHSLKHIDQLPQTSFEEIIKKYVEMNIAHPFREGNGRATRIWLALILKKELQRVVDWNLINKEDYLSAMERSPINDLEIRYLISKALTDKIDDRDLYMKGIDVSYFYEGFSKYTIDDLSE